MTTSAEAADQVVKMALNGVEVAAKITGSGAKQLAVLLYAVLKDQKRTKGKIRLGNMLRSGKELKVFAVNNEDLKKFCAEAKKYGVLYCALRDKKSKDGITDVMVRADDASKVNRIFERFKIATVDMGSVKSKIEKSISKNNSEKEVPEVPAPEKSKEELFVEEMFSVPNREEHQTQNPTEGRIATKAQSQSVPFSKKQGQDLSDRTVGRASEKKSVREELKEIRAELAEKKPSERHEPTRNNARTHKAQARKGTVRKER